MPVLVFRTASEGHSRAVHNDGLCTSANVHLLFCRSKQRRLFQKKIMPAFVRKTALVRLLSGPRRCSDTVLRHCANCCCSAACKHIFRSFSQVYTRASLGEPPYPTYKDFPADLGDGLQVFVGGLAPSVDELAFRQYFEQFGAVEDAVVMYDHDSKRPRGFGFVTFVLEDTVDQARHSAPTNCC